MQRNNVHSIVFLSETFLTFKQKSAVFSSPHTAATILGKNTASPIYVFWSVKLQQLLNTKDLTAVAAIFIILMNMSQSVFFLQEVCKLNCFYSFNRLNSFQDPEKETKSILC